MQKELIVPETTPIVKSWIHLNDQLIGVTEAGDYLLLATIQSMIAEKPKQKRRRRVVVEAAETEAPDRGNGEAPRKRGRKPTERAWPGGASDTVSEKRSLSERSEAMDR